MVVTERRACFSRELADYVNADLDVMACHSKKMRGSGPFVFGQVKQGMGVEVIVEHLIHAWSHATGVGHQH